MEDNVFRQKIIKILILFSVLVVFILGFDKVKWILEVLIDACAPFLIGGCIALILNIPMRFFEKRIFKFGGRYGKKINRFLSLICSLFLIAIIIGLICLLIVPKVADTIDDITYSIPRFLVDIIEKIEQNIVLDEKTVAQLTKLKEAGSSWTSLVAYISSLIANGKQDAIGSASMLVGNVFDICINVIIAMFFAFYSLVEKERIVNYFRKIGITFMSEKARKTCGHIISLTHQNFEDFFFGQCLESFVVASIFTFITSLFGFECSLVVGIAMIFLALIPYVGNVLACVLGVILTLAMEGSMRAIVFAIIFSIVQLLDAYFLYPKVIALKVKMPPLLIFVTVLIGGDLFGVVGMLLTIPVATTIYLLIKEKMIQKGVELPEENGRKEKRRKFKK